jgi:hypothetical protein
VNRTQRKLGQTWVGWVTFAVFVSSLLYATSAVAEGTPAGTTIRNQATGTFEDPSNPNQEPIKIESNTVTVTVAEVAGITVQPAGIAQTNDNDQIEIGDLLFFQFKVTNVGNDPTQFRIPNTANVSGPGTISGNIQISTDGGATWPTDVIGDNFLTGSIPAGGSILVRVPILVSNTANLGDAIAVQLGNTPRDAQNQPTQNQPRTPENSQPSDLYTVDNSDQVGGEASGSPANGTREASATQRVTVSAVPRKAFSQLLKVHATPIALNNPTDPTDDVITYQLGLEVLATLPPEITGFVADDLVPNTSNNLTVDGALVPRILVSDAIPTGTRLQVNQWKAPDGWQVVFTNTPTNVNPLQADWRSDIAAVGGAAGVTRIGFLFNGTVARGTTVTGFEFAVQTSGITTTTTVANLAQMFGGSANNPGELVYDESGDQVPNNFNDDGTPGPIDQTGNPVVNPGVPNPETDGQDSSNNNTGTGPGGEANVVVIVAPGGGVFNGPEGTPNALGPENIENDFTNTAIPVSGSPPPVNFTNTVQNTTGQPILLIPTTPEDPNSLPAGTTVTITYGGRSVTYVYDPATGFVSTDPSAPPIAIPGTETSANYQVTIQLPATEPLKAYPVPISAFVDADGDGQPSPGEPANTTINRIYSGFVEVMKESRLLQGSGPAILPGQETFSTDQKTPGSGNIVEYRFTYKNISLAEGQGQGNRTLSATNFVIVEDGTTFDRINNPSGNNWALDNDNLDGDDDPKTGIDSSHVVGSAVDSTGGIIVFFNGASPIQGSERSGNTTDTDVTRYEMRSQRPIAPQETGTFVFRRQVN